MSLSMPLSDALFVLAWRPGVAVVLVAVPVARLANSRRRSRLRRGSRRLSCRRRYFCGGCSCSVSVTRAPRSRGCKRKPRTTNQRNRNNECDDACFPASSKTSSHTSPFLPGVACTPRVSPPLGQLSCGPSQIQLGKSCTLKGDVEHERTRIVPATADLSGDDDLCAKPAIERRSNRIIRMGGCRWRGRD